LADVPGFIFQVHGVLGQLGGPAAEATPEPIVSIAQSVKPDYIICLDCGKKLKTMKAHLRAQHQLSPDQYRDKWSLPASYPMVARNHYLALSGRARDGDLPARMRAAREAKREKGGKPPLKSVGGRAHGN
jgi:predicted transcriptional regulator